MITKFVNILGYDLVKKTNLKRVTLDMELYGKMRHFESLVSRIRDVEGSIVECGVGKGHTLLLLSLLNAHEGYKRDMWGFDSFQGFPSPTPEDKSPRKPKQGEWNNTSIKGILKLLRDSGIDYNFTRTRLMLVPGFFNESLKRYNGEKIALLHLDVDLYKSYKDCLNHFYSKMAKGGIIIFDEFNATADNKDFPGAFKAISAFAEKKNLKIQRDSKTGKNFVVVE